MFRVRLQYVLTVSIAIISGAAAGLIGMMLLDARGSLMLVPWIGFVTVVIGVPSLIITVVFLVPDAIYSFLILPPDVKRARHLLQNALVHLLVCFAVAVFIAWTSGYGREGTNIKENFSQFYAPELGEQEIVKVSFFDRTGESEITEDLPAVRIPDFVAKVDSYQMKSHMFYNYYWADRFGISITYANGYVMTYDGTYMTIYDDQGTDVGGGYLEILNGSFWADMKEFFPSSSDEYPVASW